MDMTEEALEALAAMTKAEDSWNKMIDEVVEASENFQEEPTQSKWKLFSPSSGFSSSLSWLATWRGSNTKKIKKEKQKKVSTPPHF